MHSKAKHRSPAKLRSLVASLPELPGNTPDLYIFHESRTLKHLPKEHVNTFHFQHLRPALRSFSMRWGSISGAKAISYKASKKMDKEQLSQLEKDDKTCPNSPIKEGNIMIKSSSLRGSFLFWGKGKTLPAPPRLANTFHDHPPTSRVRECDRWYASGLGSVQNHPVVADLVGLLAQNLSTCWDRNWLTRKWLQLGLHLILSANHLWYTLPSQHPSISTSSIIHPPCLDQNAGNLSAHWSENQCQSVVHLKALRMDLPWHCCNTASLASQNNLSPWLLVVLHLFTMKPKLESSYPAKN